MVVIMLPRRTLLLLVISAIIYFLTPHCAGGKPALPVFLMRKSKRTQTILIHIPNVYFTQETHNLATRSSTTSVQLILISLSDVVTISVQAIWTGCSKLDGTVVTCDYSDAPADTSVIETCGETPFSDEEPWVY